jgi:hypothetical protein
MAHSLKARKSKNKCEVCWRKFQPEEKYYTFQNKTYHPICWEGRFKVEKKAETKLASQKRSI